MAQDKETEIKIIMVGTHDSGKYWLGNALLNAIEDGDENLFSRPDYDLPTSQAIRKTFGHTKMYIVATPDISNESEELSLQNWQDLITAQDLCQDYTNVFLVVLNSNDPVKSKSIVTNFKTVFGDEVRSNCVVIYTNNPNPTHKNYDRELECRFDFVDEHLKKGYPVLKWNQNEESSKQTETLRTIIANIVSGSVYSRKTFLNAQIELLQRWVRKSSSKAKVEMTVEKACKFFNVPGVLMTKIFAMDEALYGEALKILNVK